MSLFSFIFICPCLPLNFLFLTQILTAVNLSRIKPDKWEALLLSLSNPAPRTKTVLHISSTTIWTAAISREDINKPDLRGQSIRLIDRDQITF